MGFDDFCVRIGEAAEREAMERAGSRVRGLALPERAGAVLSGVVMPNLRRLSTALTMPMAPGGLSLNLGLGPAQEISTELRDTVLSINGNDECVDCQASQPGMVWVFVWQAIWCLQCLMMFLDVGAEWVSLGFGTTICIDCAGKHRGLGAHITLVRSLTLDAFTPRQLAFIKTGGNNNFRGYIRENTPVANAGPSDGSEQSTGDLAIDYTDPQTLYYR